MAAVNDKWMGYDLQVGRLNNFIRIIEGIWGGTKIVVTSIVVLFHLRSIPGGT